MNYVINEAGHKLHHFSLLCIKWLQMVIPEVHIKLGDLPWTRYVSLAACLCRDTGKKGNLSMSHGQYKDSGRIMN